MKDYNIGVQSALNIYPDPIFTLNKNLEIRDFNKKFDQFLSLNQSIFKGLSLRSLSKFNEAFLLSDLIQHVNESGVIGTNKVFTSFRTTSELPYQVRVNPEFDELGKISGYYVIIQDLSELISDLEEGDFLSHDDYMQAREKENAIISNELHDGLGQNLTLIKYALQSQEPNDKVFDLIHESINNLRSISHCLNPDYVKTHKICELLDQLIEKNEIISGHIAFSYEKDLVSQSYTITDKQKLHLFRIAQEITHNIIKHSKADKATVSISKKYGCLTLRFRNNGILFDPLSQKDSDGFGLRSIKNRIQELDAYISYKTTISKEEIWNQLTVSLPL